MAADCVKAWSEWREHEWDHFLDAHPACSDRDKKPAGTAGVGAYAPAPFLAWSGWRYRIPGGPIGGQYHGFIAPDDTTDGMGWPAGHDETFRPVDNPAGLGGLPWESWDTQWGGIPLNEGETVSDYVYRGPAEIRPRPNASGGVNTVRAVQTARSAGYAIAPGNYKGIGYVDPALVYRADPIISNMGPIQYPGATGSPRACPAWGCGGPRWGGTWGGPARVTPTVTQPPPPYSPAPAPVVPIGPAGSSGCASGQYRDAAGNCTSDWRNPYALYLPSNASSPAPAPTVSANTCPTGYSVDQNGNCVPAGSVSSGGIGDWFSASTSIAGMNIPNAVLAGVGALVAMKMLGGKR